MTGESGHKLPSSFVRWIIRRATRALPEAERVEAEAEWLQHLDDLPTRQHKLRHVIGLWASSGVIKPEQITLNLDWTNVGSAILLIATLGQTTLDIKNGAPLAVIFPEIVFGLPGAGIALVTGLLLRRKGKFHTID